MTVRSPTTLAWLGLILVVATWLRFSRLDSQPMHLDEAMTTMICLGRSPRDVPTGSVLPLDSLATFFSFRDGSTAGDVWNVVADESAQMSHPPLYFVGTHAWLSLRRPSLAELTWAMRASSATLGVLSVAAMFALGTVAFSPLAGLVAAAFAAVSPMGVMLAQEARNYTIATLTLTLALTAMVAIIRRAAQGNLAGPSLWLAWIAAAIASLYAHYYCGLSIAAQALILLVVVGRRSLRGFLAVLCSSAVVAIAFAPWTPALPAHLGMPTGPPVRDAAAWLDMGYDVLKACQAMLTGRTLEVSSVALRETSRALALVVTVWTFAVGVIALRGLWRDASTAAATRALVAVTVIVVAEMGLAVLTITHRDLWSTTRHQFQYTPSVAALLGVSCAALADRSSPGISWHTRVLRPRMALAVGIVGIAGLVGSLLTVHALKFPKAPPVMGLAIATSAGQPRPVLVAFGAADDNIQEALVGVTNLLEIHRRTLNRAGMSFVFVRRLERAPERREIKSEGSDPTIFWRWLGRIHGLDVRPATMWVSSIGFGPDDHPQRFRMATDRAEPFTCTRERLEFMVAPADDDVRLLPSLYHCRADE